MGNKSKKTNMKESVKNSKNNNTKNSTPTASKANPKTLNIPYKVIIEDKIKVFLGAILIVLFMLLFASVAWYFLTQVEATFVSGTASMKSIFPLL